MILATNKPKKNDHNSKGSFLINHSSILEKTNILERIPPKTASKKGPFIFFQTALNPTVLANFMLSVEILLMLSKSFL